MKVENPVGVTKLFYKPGSNILHREDGPAVIRSDGYRAWYRNGKKHRDDGPAVTTREGKEFWYDNGKIHREDGPAINGPEYSSWFRYGFAHRLDGPAIIQDSYIAYFVNGVYYSNIHSFNAAVTRWLSYREMTHKEVANLIGDYRIVEW